MAATKGTPESAQKRSEGIRRAKASPEHRQRMSDITKALWQREEFRKKRLGKIPWNKMSDENKIKKECPICKTNFLVVPSHAKTRRCCSLQCSNEYRRITPHTNWNPNSLIGTGYSKTLRGTLCGLSFRSSYELFVLHDLLTQKKDIKVESFFYMVRV